MDIKTQTKRSTRFKTNLINFNCFIDESFEFGVVTSKYWGDFEKRKNPLIEIEVNGIRYNLLLSEFKKFVEINLKKWKNWDG